MLIVIINIINIVVVISGTSVGKGIYFICPYFFVALMYVCNLIARVRCHALFNLILISWKCVICK